MYKNAKADFFPFLKFRLQANNLISFLVQVLTKPISPVCKCNASLQPKLLEIQMNGAMDHIYREGKRMCSLSLTTSLACSRSFSFTEGQPCLF